ncbi:MAG TPA: PilT/PilU family type 4a pilus ATPase [Actinomycetota bacterium]|jgi:twitching motility protein PilT|nr:PilT/PilU family type 4a pilus ATPase [Actinomycetota bacterium]
MDAADLLHYAVERGASDLHLSAGNVPFIRVDGELLPTAFPVLVAAQVLDIAQSLMPLHKREEFARSNEADFAYTLDGVARFRANVLRQRGSVALAIRQVASEGQTFDELRLPAVVQTLAESRRGLILVTGPTGAGKTTTIAAMLGFINRTRRAHIVTVEDPIEVLHSDDLSLIWQREVGLDTESYAAGLRQVLRQDPDVIFVGEIRDAAAATSAIQAAQTGHLVVSTMHTIDAAETVSRIVALFPDREQHQIRASFAGALRGIVSQRLLERIDGRGRIPAVEVLLNNGRVTERIVDQDSTAELTDVIAEGRYDGMQTFDQALVQLVHDGLVAEDDARAVATNPHDFSLALSGAGRGIAVAQGA